MSSKRKVVTKANKPQGTNNFKGVAVRTRNGGVMYIQPKKDE